MPQTVSTTRAKQVNGPTAARVARRATRSATLGHLRHPIREARRARKSIRRTKLMPTKRIRTKDTQTAKRARLKAALEPTKNAESKVVGDRHEPAEVPSCIARVVPTPCTLSSLVDTLDGVVGADTFLLLFYLGSLDEMGNHVPIALHGSPGRQESQGRLRMGRSQSPRGFRQDARECDGVASVRDVMRAESDVELF